MHTRSLRAVARLSVLAAGAALAATSYGATPASAMPVEGSGPATVKIAAHGHVPVERDRPTDGERIIDLASREAGDPYVYGAAGPDAFDCSGFTQYVFAQVGISLPHSSSAQAAMVEPVSDPQVGDLVFFTGSGGVYHVAIYAGDNTVWHSPRSGDVVSQAPIWTSSVFYGRVV